MKTLFEMEFYGNEPSMFFQLEGDYRHLNDVTINLNHENSPQRLQDELYDLIDNIVYDSESIIAVLKEPTKDWDYFVKVGCIP
jgi:hypothetical protein